MNEVEVWDALDHEAGRLSRRTQRRLWFAVAGTFVLLVVVIAGYQSGTVVPYLDVTLNGYESGVPPVPPELHLLVANYGVKPVRITGAGGSVPGLELTGARDAYPITLKPNQSMTIVLTYRVLDCDSVPEADRSVPVKVDRPWGTYTIRSHLGSFHGATWPRFIAQSACDFHS